ncbi:MAG: AraC-like DNA-binding protein [Gammaproteobacteria bacterium]|jgi:AraC-like DNA-binding protein
MNGLMTPEPSSPVRLRKGLQGYQSAIRSAFAPMDVAPPAPGKSYAWSVSGKQCGALDLSHIYAVGPIRAVIPTEESAAASKVILAFVAEGTFECEQSGRHAVCGPQSLTLLDTARPLIAEQHGPVELLSVVLPRNFLQSRIPDLERVCAVSVSSKSGAPAVLRDLIKSSWRESPSMGREQALVMPQLFASLIYSVFVDADHLKSVTANSAKLSLFRNLIQHVIDDELRNVDLGPRLIADRLAISKSYLFVVARKLNISIQQWIIDCRLDSCRTSLNDPACANQTITDIAFASGFKDAAHFSRRFSQRFKMSPKEFRDCTNAAK